MKNHKTTLSAYYYKAAHAGFLYLVKENREMRYGEFYNYISSLFPDDLLTDQGHPKSAVINKVLGIIQCYCVTKGIPPVNQLVCNEDGPGKGIDNTHWKKNVSDVKQFMWKKVPEANEIKEVYKLNKVLTNSGVSEQDALRVANQYFS